MPIICAMHLYIKSLNSTVNFIHDTFFNSLAKGGPV